MRDGSMTMWMSVLSGWTTRTLLLFLAGSQVSPFSLRLRHAAKTDILYQKRHHDRSCLGMFTGIIEEIGEVVSLDRKEDAPLWDGSKGRATEMVIKGDIALEGSYLGCSISVNGVCLTATNIDFANKRFTVGLAPETLRKTNLGTYDPLSLDEKKRKVNLERASEVGGRNSGHFVQGHVDNVGTIVDRWTEENSQFFKISFPHDSMRYIVPKGFVAVDGTSLTVCDVHCGELSDLGDNWFTLMLVEYTQRKIVLPLKEVGDTVNVEVDVLGKYSERAWEVFAPKMVELQKKVMHLEDRVRKLENSSNSRNTISESAKQNTVWDRAATTTTKYGDAVPKSFNRRIVDETDGLISKSDNAVSDAAWVRSKQTFLGRNY